jgi:predicted lipoprotein with Yx(FWY)xxD motif
MHKNNKWIIVIVILVAIAIVGYVIYFIGTSNQKKSTVIINNAIVTTKSDPNIGNYLADPSDKTLYIYNGDTAGISNCTNTCLSRWPAYIDTGAATGLPAGFGTITRKDRTIQYTYNNMPLYYFYSDNKGQITSNGLENFKVAIPSATTLPSTVTPSNTNDQSSPSYN